MNQPENTEHTASAQDKLLEGLKGALNEAEALLRSAANATGDQAAELRARAVDSLRATRESLYDTQDSLVRQGRKAVREADDYVHDKPWQAVAAAGVVGLLLGLLLSRR
jgi:ElaB/YqjD/DUF883 family membrane-anchored ribosome-binding protein